MQMNDESKDRPIKDCRKCDRRRIRCDRTLPACLKCTARGLICPGYQKPLKWVCGPASKGPNRRELPSDDPISKTQNSESPTTLEVVDPRITGVRNAEIQIRSPLDEVRIQPNQFIFSHPQEQNLFDHFNRVVSKQLAWYEDDGNPWRKLVLPLAMRSQSLSSVILGLSAGNISSRVGNDSPIVHVHDRAMTFYRDKALKLITKDLETIRSSYEETLQEHQQELLHITIASILLLLYLELHWPTSGVWRLHLDAVQKVNDIVQMSKIHDPTTDFLAEEVFALSTWPLLTNFDWPASNPNDFLIDESPYLDAVRFHPSAFSAFVPILRSITWAERKYYRHTDITERQQALSQAFSQVQSDLLGAHQSAKQGVRSRKKLHPELESEDIEHLVDAWFSATKIYSCQALLPSLPSEMDDLRQQLFQSLLAFKCPDAYAQDQPWPLFIAGTESTGRSFDQQWVEHRVNSIMHANCKMDRPRMLGFLRGFWTRESNMNWINYGRIWTKSQHDFLIL